MIPGHDQGRGASGAAAHGSPATRVLGEFPSSLGFDARQHFLFHELRVDSGHGVVLKTAFTALRVPLPLPMEIAIIAGTLCWAIKVSGTEKSSGSGPSAPTMNGATLPGTYCLGT